MTHAFFAIMGGFQFHDRAGPSHPLSPNIVVELVKHGHLVPPTAEEISNQSKGDALSKGVVIVQTLWFVTQCIARRAERLPLIKLEVMTLAYTVMTVAMYIAWWDKPLNVSCAVRVPKEAVAQETEDEDGSIWGQVYMYVVGGQDQLVDLRRCERVPTFWAGNPDDDVILLADVIALLVAMVFGAVHCIAWSSQFQSHLEQQLWRYSAIAIIAVPVALVLVILLALPSILVIDYLDINISANVGIALIGVAYTAIAITYTVARLVLIVLSFTSLGHLPLEAYQTVQWTTFIPHI